MKNIYCLKCNDDIKSDIPCGGNCDGYHSSKLLFQCSQCKSELNVPVFCSEACLREYKLEELKRNIAKVYQKIEYLHRTK